MIVASLNQLQWQQKGMREILTRFYHHLLDGGEAAIFQKKKNVYIKFFPIKSHLKNSTGEQPLTKSHLSFKF